MGYLEITFVVFIAMFGASLLFISVYSVAQIQLVFRYLNFKKSNAPIFDESNSPTVCIQLPIYNELYVSKRLLSAITKIKYPSHRLEIQILDDSTDETQDILKKEVAHYKNSGVNITYLHRINRVGYKAGALKEGLAVTKAEFIAIFDADFVPSKNFLIDTIAHFKNAKVGMVQTCWEHINKNYSLLTKLQAFALDAHFSVEQVGRNAKNNFINFNGTAGVWRKSCILDAGDWNADTLTEDLDLSYRAQLKNWKFVYLEDVKSPAELPPVMSALRSQQYRWTKGGAETAKKHLWNVLKSGKSFSDKWHGFFHLLNSSIFVFILVSGIISIPLLFLKQGFKQYDQLFLYSSFFLLSFVSISALYAVSSVRKHETKKQGWLHFLTHFPLFLSFSMGLSFHNASAVLEGYFGRKTPFVRTPKFNIQNSTDSWKKNTYLSKDINIYSIFEAFLFLYFLVGLIAAFAFKDFSLFFFHVLLCTGFGMVFYYSTKRSK
ncbi:MAG: cellulose synthase/poly-beta-1,6-N-acetylglucosamine synthase-like glycosyltransferase [Saprospiraceae bacterium]|jgi:cellulose synthase/poly-beta-1,6-N-acetylglucosamine synthase-like glycosyltransferase